MKKNERLAPSTVLQTVDQVSLSSNSWISYFPIHIPRYYPLLFLTTLTQKSLKQHQSQTVIKTFHHIALTLSSRGWIHWHSSGSTKSALVPFFRDAVLLAPIQKRLQVLREYDSWPKIFVYTRLFKQFSRYFWERALFQFDLWLRAQETSCT